MQTTVVVMRPLILIDFFKFLMHNNYYSSLLSVLLHGKALSFLFLVHPNPRFLCICCMSVESYFKNKKLSMLCFEILILFLVLTKF